MQGEMQKDHFPSYGKKTQMKRSKCSSWTLSCQCVKKYGTILASKAESELEDSPAQPDFKHQSEIQQSRRSIKINISSTYTVVVASKFSCSK